MILTPSPEELWAWLGRGSEPIDAAAVREWLAANGSPELPIGVGEPKSERSGWRLTHRQANAAVWVAKGQGAPFVAYPQAALLASLGRDALLTNSLHEGYLLPFTAERDGGEALRRTLRAYFRSNRNATSAGSSIGVSRQTVSNRVRLAERYLGQKLEDCGLVLEVALELEEIGCFTDLRDSRS